MLVDECRVPEEDKVPFLCMLALVARADGQISADEKQFIDAILLAWKFESNEIQQVYKILEDGADLVSVAASFKNPKSPYLLLQDLIALAYVDGEYSDRERIGVREISNAFSISEERVCAIESWVAQGVEWRKNGLVLTQPEGA